MADSRKTVNLPSSLLEQIDEVVKLLDPLYQSRADWVRQAITEKLIKEHPKYAHLRPGVQQADLRQAYELGRSDQSTLDRISGPGQTASASAHSASDDKITPTQFPRTEASQ